MQNEFNAISVKLSNNERGEKKIFLVIMLINKKIYKNCFKENEEFVKFFFFIIEKIEVKRIVIFSYNLDIWGFLFVYYLNKINNIKIKVSCVNLELYSVQIKMKNKSIVLKNIKKIIEGELSNFFENFDLKFIEIPDEIDVINENNFIIKRKKFSKGNWFYFLLRKRLKIKKLDDLFLFYEEKNLKNFCAFLINFHKFLYMNLKINIFQNNICSLSGVFFNGFFCNFNNYSISDKLKDSVYIYIKDSYYGGRCEIFNNPSLDEKIYYFDYNGMYSQCMLDLFPVDSGEYVYNNFSLDCPGFYDIIFESNGMKYPVLPTKNSMKKVFFANGESSGVYWYEEIKLFLDMGGKIIKINSGYVFKELGLVFFNYVNKIESIKKGEDKKNIKMFLKKAINSTYGRFAFSKNNDKVIILDWEYFYKNIINKEGVKKYIKINSFVVLEYNSTILKLESSFMNFSSNNSNIIYASIITSKARIKLYKSFTEVREKGFKLLYCDTDSLFFSIKKEKNIEKKDFSFFDLVKWEEKNIDQAVFINIKTYAIKYKIGCKIIFNGEKLKKKRSFFKIKKKFYNNKNGFDQKVYTKRFFDKSKKKTRPLFLINGLYF